MFKVNYINFCIKKKVACLNPCYYLDIRGEFLVYELEVMKK